jgi:hypothetical protein
MIDNEEYLTKDNIVLFGPRDGKTIKKLYREIAEDPIFKAVTNNEELLWAWYMGIPHSPIDENLPETTRCRVASSRCITDKSKRERFAEYNIPDEVRMAVEKFKRFSPEGRLIAQRAVQEMIFTLQKLSYADDSAFFSYRNIKDDDGNVTQVKEMDWAGRKNYVDSCKTIAATLPELIKKLEEGGYGITEQRKTEDTAKGGKPIDIYHQKGKQ